MAEATKSFMELMQTTHNPIARAYEKARIPAITAAALATTAAGAKDIEEKTPGKRLPQALLIGGSLIPIATIVAYIAGKGHKNPFPINKTEEWAKRLTQGAIAGSVGTAAGYGIGQLAEKWVNTPDHVKQPTNING